MTNEESERLVAPSVALLVSGLLSGLLVYDALAIESGTDTGSGRRRAMGAAIHAIAEGIGVTGSIAVAVVTVLASVVWMLFTLRSIRAARTPR